MTDFFDFLPGSWSDSEKDLWSTFEGTPAFNDQQAQVLYNEAYFEPGAWDKDQRSVIRGEFHDYMMDNYGIDFEAEFDWVAWREAYGETA